MLTHIDLFAGIGGFSLGFERAGIDTLAHVEIDKNCQDVLTNHWPDHLVYSDVSEVGKHNLPYADIITFGSPCQDLSVAGKRKGFEDGTRSSLFFEAARIVREIGPRFAIWENVPGALSSHNGRDFQSVLECLLECSIPMPRSGRWATAGMVRTGQKEIAWRVLDAQYFGVPQRRRRVFLVFCARGDSAAEILFEREGSEGLDSEAIEKGGEISCTASGISGAVSTKWLKGGGPAGDEKYNLITEPAWIPCPDCEEEYYCNLHKCHVSECDCPGIDTWAEWEIDPYSPCLVRRLTPTECARLQGFPDDWNDWLSDASRYRQFGNAVAVPVAEWIGRRIAG